METNRQYYSRRAAEEIEAAERATSSEAKERHRILAHHYSAIIADQEHAPSEEGLEQRKAR